MRWTIYVDRYGKQSDFDSKPIDVVSASFTDEDVERVAEAIALELSGDKMVRPIDRGLAYAALTAFLKG